MPTNQIKTTITSKIKILRTIVFTIDFIAIGFILISIKIDNGDKAITLFALYPALIFANFLVFLVLKTFRNTNNKFFLQSTLFLLALFIPAFFIAIQIVS
jgi:hypothetical protein